MASAESSFERALQALDDGDLSAAWRAAEAGLAESRRAGEDERARVPGLYVLAAVHAERGEDDAALALLDRVLTLDPGHGDAAYLHARLHLARWDFEEVERQLASRPERDTDAAMLHLRATALELRGEQAAADRLYRLAARLDPENFPAPVRISDDEVHALVEETIASMPREVVATFANMSVDLWQVPDPALHGDVDPEILGLYAGTPVGEPGDPGMPLPARVYLFKRNIERIAFDREELIEQLRITLLHELGHHLGLDEDDLEERGLG
ncbi:MAG TPA: metallopeptidase family protein [Planctomycetota bacterium]|nr:metallopeptidase family protein [Planctomycetota bacterium]